MIALPAAVTLVVHEFRILVKFTAGIETSLAGKAMATYKSASVV